MLDSDLLQRPCTPYLEFGNYIPTQAMVLRIWSRYTLRGICQARQQQLGRRVRMGLQQTQGEPLGSWRWCELGTSGRSLNISQVYVPTVLTGASIAECTSEN